MGKDVKWSEFFEDNRRYADIINGVVCKGQQLVSQENLSELDSRSKGKFRDAVRKVAFGVNFAIVGIENQDEIDYEFPVRIMEYDVARYRRQISAIKKSVREKGEKLKPGEYMYGFKKNSRLHPVTTIVLYAGEEQRDALYDLVSSNPYFQSMDEDAYEIISKYANINDGVVKMDDYRREDGGVNVCKGIRDLMEHSKAEGREEGVQLGVEQERRDIIINMLEMNKSIEEICKVVRCDVEYVREIMKIG